MQYLAYHFKVTPPQPGSEILVAMIADMGFESFDYNEEGFTAYIKEEEAASVTLDELQFEEFAYTFTIEKIAKTNWNSEWEKNFEPVVVGDLLCIRASFHEKNNSVANEIIITPKMSFGTGHHQTTQLMCEAMFEADFINKRVLDMGCGTGVLAILAEMRGATDILAIDIDEWSVENSVENCQVNNAKHITVKKGDIGSLDKESSFDVIIANINKNILKAHMRVYASKLRQGGLLFLSGFFTTDKEELIACAGQFGLKYYSEKSRDGWAMLRLAKL
jgi:ribosomal protein L11 methyltransferase